MLDVGCGSGFLAAAMAHINPKCTVYALETVPELVDLSKKNIGKDVSLLQISLISSDLFS